MSAQPVGVLALRSEALSLIAAAAARAALEGDKSFHDDLLAVCAAVADLVAAARAVTNAGPLSAEEIVAMAQLITALTPFGGAA